MFESHNKCTKDMGDYKSEGTLRQKGHLHELQIGTLLPFLKLGEGGEKYFLE